LGSRVRTHPEERIPDEKIHEEKEDAGDREREPALP
jgi:hypothetical protein